MHVTTAQHRILESVSLQTTHKSWIWKDYENVKFRSLGLRMIKFTNIFRDIKFCRSSKFEQQSQMMITNSELV